MTDTPRREETDPTQPLGYGYPGYGYADPAYAGQNPYSPHSAVPDPTERLPSFPPYGYDPDSPYSGYPPGAPDEPPSGGPRSPRWLWMLAGAAVLIVIALVIALVIVNGSQPDTVLAPRPTATEPTLGTTTPTPTTTAPPTTTTTAPAPSTTPSTTAAAPPPTAETVIPTGTDTVVYTVSGPGRAINITYLGTGNVFQTEFNVALPWSTQVELPRPATGKASVSILNFGREVACTVTVNGVVTRQTSGSGVTVCLPTR